MKERILKNLKKLRNPSIIKYPSYSRYLEEAIDYVSRCEEAPDKVIEIKWLQKRVLDDVYARKCDSLVFSKLSKYIHEYEEQK